MSTDQLLDVVLKRVPDADPATILDLIVSCDANVTKVLGLLGVESGASRNQRQSTFKVTKSIAQRPTEPIRLHTPEQVADADICCSLHLNVLEETVANRLALHLRDQSKEWINPKFYLFDREVQAPHLSGLYTDEKSVLSGERALSYQGRPIKKMFEFPLEMSMARDTVKKLVEEECDRKNWNCNVVLCNCYKDKQSHLSYHSDQLTHIGPEPVIASLSLGCAREIRLQHRNRKKTDPSYFSVRLPHNSAFIMHGGCQEKFKHCIPAARVTTPQALLGSTRLSLTFRHYLAEFDDDAIPKCRCGEPMILRTSTASDNTYKYIWQCATPYLGKAGCAQIKEASFQPPIDHQRGSYLS